MAAMSRAVRGGRAIWRVSKVGASTLLPSVPGGIS
jgi:hypothetical protein